MRLAEKAYTRCKCSTCRVYGAGSADSTGGSPLLPPSPSARSGAEWSAAGKGVSSLAPPAAASNSSQSAVSHSKASCTRTSPRCLNERCSVCVLRYAPHSKACIRPRMHSTARQARGGMADRPDPPGPWRRAGAERSRARQWARAAVPPLLTSARQSPAGTLSAGTLP